MTIFAKSSILDVWQDSEFASTASFNFAQKAPSQIFDRVLNLSLITSKNLKPLVIFAKLLPICLLHLINITVVHGQIHLTLFSKYLLMQLISAEIKFCEFRKFGKNLRK